MQDQLKLFQVSGSFSCYRVPVAGTRELVVTSCIHYLSGSSGTSRRIYRLTLYLTIVCSLRTHMYSVVASSAIQICLL